MSGGAHHARRTHDARPAQGEHHGPRARLITARPGDRWIVRAAPWVLGIGVGFIAVYSAARLCGAGDFTHFYAAGKAVLDGTDLYASGSGGYIYPPFPAIAFSPLTLLPKAAAGVLWVLANAVLLIASLLLLAREVCVRMGIEPTRAAILPVAALGFVLCCEKTLAVLKLGQTDIVTFALIVLALAIQRAAPLATGVALGVACNIKYQAVVFIPYFLLRGRWRELLGLLSAAAVCQLSGSLVFGWDRNLSYLHRAFGSLLASAGLAEKPFASANILDISWQRSVSIPSAFARLAEKFGDPSILVGGTVAAGVCVLALCALLYLRRGVRMLVSRGGANETAPPLAWVAVLEWAGLIAGVLAFSPQTTARHLFLLIFATTIAAALLCVYTPRVRKSFLFVGLAVLWIGWTLPPGGKRFEHAVLAWKAVGGPAWCAIVFYCTLLWTGLGFVRYGSKDGTPTQHPHPSLPR